MRSIAGIAGAACACTSLGPMPATTGVSAVPVGRAGAELQAGLVPMFRLSDAASTEDRNGRVTPQLLSLIEPDRLFVPGLIAGLRGWGEDHDTIAEPFIGYRRRLDARRSGGVVVYGTLARANQNGASYAAKRLGAEAMFDAELVRWAGWLSLHAQAAAQLTALVAGGTYCVDPAGVAIDCSDTEPNVEVDGKLAGLYPAATGGLSIDLLRRSTSPFHGVRLGLLGAVGRMPNLRGGRQRTGDSYASAGLTLTIGFGGRQ